MTMGALLLDQFTYLYGLEGHGLNQPSLWLLMLTLVMTLVIQFLG